MPEPPRRDGGGKDALAALAVGALAIGCCAGLPLIAALVGSIAAATLLGLGGGVLAAIVMTSVVVYRVRARRRSCETADPGRDRPPQRRPGTTERA